MEEPKGTILAVDDDPRNLEILLEIFDGVHEVETAPSGEKALEMLKDKVPDLILLDIMMPGIDGFEVCRQIRANPDFNSVKILLVSGKAMVEDRLKGYESGADDYVTKPFVDDELLAKANAFFRLIKIQNELTELNRSLEEQVKIRTEQVLKSERLAFMGMHVAEIVHNLKNPLTIIMGGIEILQSSYPDEEVVGWVQSGCEKLSSIVKTILSTSKDGKNVEKQEVNINETINSELELFKAKDFFKNKVDVELELTEDIPSVWGVRSHFSQSLGNIIGNAIDAMYRSENKILSIKTGKRDENIEVTISDSGCGIPEDKLENIFDPFYTSKPSSGKEDEPVGTGLGLASCKKMLEAYGASVTVKSTVGTGTTFSILIPQGR
jgi:signal transduction histidine kinase